MIRIRPATEADALDLAPRLRAGDLAEIHAGSGRPVGDVLAESVERSVEAWTALADDVPFAIWGLGAASLMFGPGVPWMMASDELARHPRFLMRTSRQHRGRWLARYDRLANVVHAANRPSLRYLRALGFAIDAPLPMGIAGAPFHLFHLERPAEEYVSFVT